MSGSTVVTAVTLAIGENGSKIAYFLRSARAAHGALSTVLGLTAEGWPVLRFSSQLFCLGQTGVALMIGTTLSQVHDQLQGVRHFLEASPPL